MHVDMGHLNSRLFLQLLLSHNLELTAHFTPACNSLHYAYSCLTVCMLRISVICAGVQC